MGNKLYGIADKAWQPIVGCDPHMSCAPRCWARRTVARVVECQRPTSPKRAEFYQIALTPDGKQWSGKTVLDRAHLNDPLKWRKPAVVATGFHGDWGRLCDADMSLMVAVMISCPQHQFMTLTKQPEAVFSWARYATDYQRGPVPNVSIGCSVMNQTEADRMRVAMGSLSALGWRTHVWYEPAIGPVRWDGWQFIEQLIIGGESGPEARPFDIAWARHGIAWAKDCGIRCFVKQLGGAPVHNHGNMSFGGGLSWIKLTDRKGSDPAEWPADLRVRELP